MNESDQLPIARRRSKRRCCVLSPELVPQQNDGINQSTPSKQRSKRFRFSDTDLLASRTTSTGLTPFVSKASLSTPRRRALTPTSPHFRQLEEGEVQFTPFRQVLDDRFKRRLRRHGLSEEMNEYESERKTKAQLQKEIEAKDIELKRLRRELEAAKNTDAAASSQLVVEEVETELAQLRQSFSEHEVNQDDMEDIDWDHVRRSAGPGSDGGDTIPIWEDDEDIGVLPNQPLTGRVDTDLLAMAVDLEAARSEKDRLFNSSFRSQSSTWAGLELNFADSPARRMASAPMRPVPTPSSDFYQNLSRTLKDTTRRAEDAELALQAFEVEVKSLGFDGETANATLSNIATQLRAARLELEHLMPGETESGFQGSKVLPEITKKLGLLVRQIRDRDGELKSLREQQRTLKGNFDHALMVENRAKAKVSELEAMIDQSAEETLGIRMKNQTLERSGVEKDTTIQRLIQTLEKYREDVARLEGLIEQLEREHSEKVEGAKNVVSAEFAEKMSDLDAQVAAEQTGRRAAEASAVERLARIKELELALSSAQQHSSEVSKDLTNLKTQVSQQSTQHSAQLAALNTRISNLSTALVSAEAEVQKLKATKEKLEKRLIEEQETGATAVERMQEYIIKGAVKASEQRKQYLRRAKIRGANWELQEDDDASSSVVGPLTPASVVRFADADDYDYVEDLEDDHIEGSVDMERGRQSRSVTTREPGKGKQHRRRHDSAIGMQSLMEEVEDGGLLTPELSSEPDYTTAE